MGPDDDGCDAALWVHDERMEAVALLQCHRPAGHDGLHWDGVDNVTWKAGKTDE